MENIFRDSDRLDLPSDPVQEWFSNPAAEVRENAVRLCHGCKGNQANFLSEFQSICAQKAVYLVGQSFFGLDLKQDITVPGSTPPVALAFVVIFFFWERDAPIETEDCCLFPPQKVWI